MCVCMYYILHICTSIYNSIYTQYDTDIMYIYIYVYIVLNTYDCDHIDLSILYNSISISFILHSYFVHYIY